MKLQIQELSFILFVKDLNPAIIHPAILQYLGILPAQWELVENPAHSDREVKLVFTNKVSLMIQPNRIVFAETIGEKELRDVQIIQIITAYLQTFSNIEYQAISINPSGYIACDSVAKANEYMTQNLLSSSYWRLLENQDINGVQLRLAYPYKSGNFYLDIYQANIELFNQVIPAIWFAGNFNYQLSGNNSQQKLENLETLIQQWKIDVNTFRDFIGQKFLASGIVPAISLFSSIK